MRKVMFVILFFLTSYSCLGPNKNSKRVLVDSEIDNYIVTKISSKDSYVDLVRLSDGRNFNKVPLGRECNLYNSEFHKGDLIIARRYIYTDGYSDFIEFNINEIRDCFCY